MNDAAAQQRGWQSLASPQARQDWHLSPASLAATPPQPSISNGGHARQGSGTSSGSGGWQQSLLPPPTHWHAADVEAAPAVSAGGEPVELGGKLAARRLTAARRQRSYDEESEVLDAVDSPKKGGLVSAGAKGVKVRRARRSAARRLTQSYDEVRGPVWIYLLCGTRC
jgi:hypothetical protein